MLISVENYSVKASLLKYIVTKFLLSIGCHLTVEYAFILELGDVSVTNNVNKFELYADISH